jgi:death-on-curing protein
LATEVTYLTVQEAVKLHVLYMRRVGETRYGVFDKALVESAINRPRHSAAFEEADLIRQAATLLFGLIKNHPWEGGNKRTATLLMTLFLRRNSLSLKTRANDVIDACLKVERDEWNTDEIEAWLRRCVTS